MHNAHMHFSTARPLHSGTKRSVVWKLSFFILFYFNFFKSNGKGLGSKSKGEGCQTGGRKIEAVSVASQSWLVGFGLFVVFLTRKKAQKAN